MVLLNGRVIGIWSYTRQGKALSLTVELFQKTSKIIHFRIEQEAAASLACFMEMSLQLKHTAR